MHLKRRYMSIILSAASLYVLLLLQIWLTEAQTITPILVPTINPAEPEFLPDYEGSPMPTDPYELEMIWSVAWSPDDKKIAYSRSAERCNLYGENRYRVEVVDATTEQMITSFDKYENCPVQTLLWSPDGSRLLISPIFSGAWIWQTETDAVVRFINGRGGFSRESHHAWSPDGSRIASVSDLDPDVHIWDPMTGEDYLAFNVPSPWFTWSPDGTTLAVSDSSITLFDVLTGEVKSEFAPSAAKIIWSPDGTKLAGIDGKTVVIIDALKGTRTYTLYGHEQAVTQIEWYPSSTTLVSSGKDGSIRVWDTDFGELVGMFNTRSPIYSFDLNSDGSQLAYGDQNGEPRVIITADFMFGPVET